MFHWLVMLMIIGDDDGLLWYQLINYVGIVVVVISSSSYGGECEGVSVSVSEGEGSMQYYLIQMGSRVKRYCV